MKKELAGLEMKEKCSQEAWKTLFTLPAWAEFLDTLEVRLVLTRDDLENPSDNEEGLRLQGDARTLRFIIALPSLIESEFNAPQTTKEEEIEDDDS